MRWLKGSDWFSGSKPANLADELASLTVSTVRGLGWTGLRNGELLRRAESAGFTVFLTAEPLPILDRR
jgi:hypothetical protein